MVIELLLLQLKSCWAALLQLKTILSISKTLKIHPMFLSCSSSIGISIIYFGHNHRYKTLTEFKSSLITSNFTHSINQHSQIKKKIFYFGIFLLETFPYVICLSGPLYNLIIGQTTNVINCKCLSFTCKSLQWTANKAYFDVLRYSDLQRLGINAIKHPWH